MDSNEGLLKVERHSHIRILVEQRGRVTVPELSARFVVSDATIRRDLEELDSQGWVQRTHGGAVRLERVEREPPIFTRIDSQHLEKGRIGAAAASLVKDGETIFLGSGTTVLEAARCLSQDLRLTVITNSLLIVNVLVERANIELVVIGGMLRRDEHSMVGHVAEQAIGEFRADRVFMGMHAIHPRHGFTSDYLPETMTDRAILGLASQIVILADHTKFGRLSPVLIGPVTAASLIITDQDTPAQDVTDLRELGIELWLV
jgi:DeoR/GlpR family transcriptional regulator of sugar metabolism